MLQTNRVLQKEQTELYAIQKKLEQVLPVIQEALNSLKVDELHLKTQVLGLQNTPMEWTPAIDPLQLDLTEQSQIPSVMESEHINSQKIDLGMLSQLRQYDEEIDSD
ncbi:uncharacterized protein LOC108044645 isoform X2 [Drosophila rhopaloa]|nr:uncharacterized protein LOC108044645 isoform X2 [Drosophila rhopaloa]